MSSTAAFLRLVGLLLSLALPSLAFGSEAEYEDLMRFPAGSLFLIKPDLRWGGSG